MNHNIRFSALLFFAITAISSFAQDSAPPPPPKDPLLSRAPKTSEWSIEEKSAISIQTEQTAEPESQDPPRKRIISKSGTIYREVTNNLKHGSTVKWVIDGLQVRQLPGSNRLSRIPRSQFSSHYSDYRRSDFEPFEWISRDNYRGVEKYDGKLCYVFEVTNDKKRLTPREMEDRMQEQSEDDSTEQPQAAIPAENLNASIIAYLDVTTQLPVALHEGGIITTYTFLPTPETKLQPPKEVLENIVAWRESINSRTPLPPKP